MNLLYLECLFYCLNVFERCIAAAPTFTGSPAPRPGTRVVSAYRLHWGEGPRGCSTLECATASGHDGAVSLHTGHMMLVSFSGISNQPKELLRGRHRSLHTWCDFFLYKIDWLVWLDKTACFRYWPSEENGSTESHQDSSALPTSAKWVLGK